MKILIQKTDNKFVNNLNHTKSNHELIVTELDSVLYQTFYKLKPNVVIFMASKCENKEVNQFILEFQDKIKCYIYYDNNSHIKPHIKTYKNAYHLTEDKKAKENPDYKIIKLPKLINDSLFNDSDIGDKNEDIVCFIDNITNIDEELKLILYPHTNLKIKLFNNPKIKHHQNLGTINEQQKAKLLKKSKYFLAIDDSYINEAVSCGCEILSIKDTKNLKPSKQYNVNIKNLETYSNFIEKTVNEN
jgi:hypothetical protein